MRTIHLHLEKLPKRVKNDRHEPTVYLVKDAERLAEGDAAILGMLEKYSNTRTDTHPWKAFAGWGANRVFLGTFWNEIDLDAVLRGEDYNFGGKDAALEAILNA